MANSDIRKVLYRMIENTVNISGANKIVKFLSVFSKNSSYYITQVFRIKSENNSIDLRFSLDLLDTELNYDDAYKAASSSSASIKIFKSKSEDGNDDIYYLQVNTDKDIEIVNRTLINYGNVNSLALEEEKTLTENDLSKELEIDFIKNSSKTMTVSVAKEEQNEFFIGGCSTAKEDSGKLYYNSKVKVNVENDSATLSIGNFKIVSSVDDQNKHYLSFSAISNSPNK